jgi:hypothetical protein
MTMLNADLQDPEVRKELRACLDKMRHTSGFFYRDAIQLGVHPFIEITGFINEYIQLCEDALYADVDFRDISQHTDTRLPLPENTFRMHYIAEKFSCMFKPWLASPAMRDAFLEGLANHGVHIPSTPDTQEVAMLDQPLVEDVVTDMPVSPRYTVRVGCDPHGKWWVGAFTRELLFLSFGPFQEKHDALAEQTAVERILGTPKPEIQNVTWL